METITRPEAPATGTTTRPTLNHAQLIERILSMPDRIERMEQGALDAETRVEAAERGLAETERRLLLSGEIDGKNAEIREAQIYQHTAPLHSRIADLRWQVQAARVSLRRMQAEFSALKAVARLLGGDGA